MQNDSLMQLYKKNILAASKLAEDRFDAVFIASKKNILLLKKLNPMRDDFPFFTIKANLHDLSFFYGDYDLSFEASITNLEQRESESSFNYETDMPALSEAS